MRLMISDDIPDEETSSDLSKEKNFTMSKLDCLDLDILKDFLDEMSRTMKDNEHSPRLSKFVIQTKANMRKWKRNLKTRIMLSKSNNSNCEGQYMISDEEIIDERCGHAIKDSKDDNKCVECNKM